MLKKMLTVGILGGLGLAVIAGTGAWSYVRTGMHSARQTMRENVPVEWEIKRARDMIHHLEPEIRHNYTIVAREEVAVKRLAEEIAAKETLLAKSHSDILRLKEDLEQASHAGKAHFTYAGRKYSEEQVREDLSNRFKQFKVHEQTADKLNQVLAAREKNLDASRRKLESMLAAKRELEVEIENIQARLTLVEVAETHAPVTLDDSRLSSTRKLLDEIRTRIDVAERMVASEGALDGTINLDEPTSEDLLEEITEYFDGDRAAAGELVSGGDSL